MSLKIIENRLDKLLAEDRPRIVLLSGEWGTGKTYQWESAVKRRHSRNDLPSFRYAYVSLFGLASISEVRRRVAEEMVSTIRLPESEETLGDRVDPDSWKLRPWQIMKLLPVVPYLSKLEGLANELSFASIKKAVVCFDDLERASPQLRLADLLGLATFLREQRNCRVILLTNSSKISQESKSSFDSYQERVVDETLLLEPTPSETAEVATSGGTSSASTFLKGYAIRLRIVNIRVIAKLHSVAQELQQVMSEYPEKLLDRAIGTLTLFGVSLLAPSDQFPSFEYLQKYGTDEWAEFFRGARDPEKMTDEGKRHEKWHQLLQEYGQDTVTELDLEIAASLKRGYVLPEVLKPLAEVQSKKVLAESAKENFTDAMQLLWSSYEDNKDVVVKAFKDAAGKASAHISLADMHWVYYVLSELEGREEAMKALELFIASNQHRPEIFSSEDPFGDITLEDFLKKIAEEREKHEIPTSLDVALDRINFSHGWNPEDVKVVAAASEEDLYGLIRYATGKTLKKRLATYVGFGRVRGDATYSEAYAKILSVFARISGESDINALRLRRYIPKKDMQEPAR